MLLHRIFFIGVFSCLVLNELCIATSVLLIAVVTCVMVEGISSLTQFKFDSGKEALLSLVHIHVPSVAL